MSFAMKPIFAAVALTLSAGAAHAFPQSPLAHSNVVAARVCFYPDGWKGPGLYECGYQFNRGFGWLGKGTAKPRKHSRRLSRRSR